MGYVPGVTIKRAGDYLLSVLKEQQSVTYDRFYDGTDTTRQKLRIGTGLSEEEADWYCVEALMDHAADLFADRGIVSIHVLDTKLIDGEPNYRITLTEIGRKFIDSDTKYQFPDLDL